MTSTPSIPTGDRVNPSRTTSASVVDGHGVHGAVSRRAANTDSSAAPRRFLNIITGAEDLHDTQTDDAVATFLNAVRQPANGRFPQGLAGHGTSDLLPLPTTSAQAAAGLYLNLHPHPHLRTDSGLHPR
ncbi:hypothetical protein [Streptomyces sp. NPDC017260]|uniref:hypothetical protein n=1 Tax=unclassified Streptomyces TaxID=2593676 RepID=UPI003797865D